MSSVENRSPIDFPINVFENQFNFGKTISEAFSENNELIYFLAFALTQSGKTGSMLSTIHHFLKDPSLVIPLDNIFILTGISSKDWVDQTKERFPSSLHHRIYHRNNLLQFFMDIEKKSDVLIILDEVHIATKNDQTMASIFKFLRFDDVEYLHQNNVKFVFFTATPNNLNFFISTPFASMAKMTPPPQYTSIIDLIVKDRVYQYKDLCGYDVMDHTKIRENVQELKDFILERFDKPLYHIIRTHTGTKQNLTLYHFNHVWKNEAIYLIDSDKLELNRLLSKAPSKHTFIFIKERLRCAKTIVKKHIGVLYERFTKTPVTSSIIQGLAGRATGYDTGNQLVVFTNLESIINDYYELWENNKPINQSSNLFR
jgi:hypothetical protein